jgi:hypothetical protein
MAFPQLFFSMKGMEDIRYVHFLNAFYNIIYLDLKLILFSNK